MNKTIWKYELALTENQTIEIPANAEILTVQTQDSILCMWALVDLSQTKEMRIIKIYGTGHPIPDDHMNYLGTCQFQGGSYVFHVFEKTIPS